MILDQETLTWYSTDAPPDVDTTVLICLPGEDEPVWLGYFTGDEWIAIDGGDIEAGKVSAWAPMPTGCLAAGKDCDC